MLTSIKVHPIAGTGGALDLEIVAIITVILEQRADDQRVDREPDRAAPVRVSAEHPGVRFGGQVLDFVFLVADIEHVRMIQVIARERANPIRAKEAFFVEHTGQDAAQLVFIEGREQQPPVDPGLLGGWILASSSGCLADAALQALDHIRAFLQLFPD